MYQLAYCTYVFPNNGHSVFAYIIYNGTYLPINTPVFDILCPPRVYSTSTVIGAAYVKSLSRHSCGVVDLVMLKPSLRSGVPTYTLVYLMKTKVKSHF